MPWVEEEDLALDQVGVQKGQEGKPYSLVHEGACTLAVQAGHWVEIDQEGTCFGGVEGTSVGVDILAADGYSHSSLPLDHLVHALVAGVSYLHHHYHPITHKVYRTYHIFYAALTLFLLWHWALCTINIRYKRDGFTIIYIIHVYVQQTCEEECSPFTASAVRWS